MLYPYYQTGIRQSQGEDVPSSSNERVDMLDQLTWHKEQRLEQAAKALGKHGFSALWVPTREEARDKVLELVPAGARVGIGGSITIRQLGVLEALEERGNPIVHHWQPGLTREADLAIRREELTAEVFLASSNAVTLTGELVNIDGIGNRTGAQSFGPGKIILVAGINKLARDVTEGLWRTRNVAAPMNARRTGAKTPCAVTGHCSDCDSPDRICRVVTILERQPSRSDITVILVGEELGY